MGMTIFRVILAIPCGFAGYMVTSKFLAFPQSLAGVSLGPSVPLVLWWIERRVKDISVNVLIFSSIGLIIGIGVANFIGYTFRQIPYGGMPFKLTLILIANLVLGYLGVLIAVRCSREIDLSKTGFFRRGGNRGVKCKILDTSVIVDGRIYDVNETGFLEGELIIPKFILYELQRIADSSDSQKRARGRRGLEILQKIQRQTGIDVKILEKDFPRIKKVDEKLVALAKQIKGKVVSNDYNLNKVAELQGVEVLNINRLANSLKPVVLPGELMKVHIIKEGKEHNQGVAYLDDGTMVIVDDARRCVGKSMEVAVTSVLQTTAGRMIFSRIHSGPHRGYGNNRGYQEVPKVS